MIVYQARQVKNREDFQCQLDTLDRAYVAHYPWGGTFQPKTYACLGWDTQGLHLYMRSYEAPVREGRRRTMEISIWIPVWSSSLIPSRRNGQTCLSTWK